MTSRRRPTLDVHHVRHLFLTCTTALGLALAGGCGNGTPNGGKPKPVVTTSNDTDETVPKPAVPAVPEIPAIIANYPGDQTNPSPATPPKSWFDDVEEFVGLPWYEVSLITYMHTFPKGMDSGTHYVVFYRRSCDHCEEMFYYDFAPDPELASKVTAVEVPEDATTMTTTDSPWEMPLVTCELLQLPVGANYIVTSPIALRIEDGIVTCATEGAHKECLGLD